MLPEAEHRSMPTVETRYPMMKTRRRPATSPSQPSVSSSPTLVTQNATFIHSTVEVSVLKASATAG